MTSMFCDTTYTNVCPQLRLSASEEDFIRGTNTTDITHLESPGVEGDSDGDPLDVVRQTMSPIPDFAIVRQKLSENGQTVVDNKCIMAVEIKPGSALDPKNVRAKDFVEVATQVRVQAKLAAHATPTLRIIHGIAALGDQYRVYTWRCEDLSSPMFNDPDPNWEPPKVKDPKTKEGKEGKGKASEASGSSKRVMTDLKPTPIYTLGTLASDQALDSVKRTLRDLCGDAL